MLKLNHQKVIEALLILRGETGVSIPDLEKIIKSNDFEYLLYLLTLIEENLKDSPLILKFNPIKKRYFFALPNQFYNYLAEKKLIKSAFPKSILATIACIVLETEAKSVTIDSLKELRGESVLNHLKALEKEGLIIIENEKVFPTEKLLIKIDINQILKAIKTL
ncbi:MAG: SMC-Scp complex subunit ScpB [Candidatus Helarchaeota archaeon]